LNRDARKLEMRQRILATADRLFYGQGIRAVGVDTIAAEVGISKRTLYNHFSSKDVLVAAYLKRRYRGNTLTDAPPAAQILDWFDRLATRVAAPGFRGCPFVNAVAELGTREHPASRVAAAFKAEQREWARTLLARAGVCDPDVLATQIALLVDGAIVGVLVRGDVSIVAAARDAARALLVDAGAMPAGSKTRQPSSSRVRVPQRRR
jgi:AcrR family transcriptional regulator